MNLSTFIKQHTEQILAEWEAFATTFGAAADQMTSLELRDHAKQILEFVVRNIQQAETAEQTEAKLRGEGPGSGPASGADDHASVTHGELRFASGFTLLQVMAEYRALRASVLKLWNLNDAALSEKTGRDVMRFNEAIDESLAVAAMAYSDKVGETRDTFLAILGHDLRGPLAATATAGAFLARPGAFDERVTQTGMRIQRSVATMSGMVDDLLALVRTQLGDGIPIERRQCDLRAMSDWAIEDAQAAYPRARFVMQTSGNLTGAFDQGRLQQVLTNLANNAAQYGTPGKPISVRIEGEPDRVLFKVRNDGPAIDPARIDTLFTSLVQLPEKAGDDRPRSSLGLGLFIAMQITRAHGGDITVLSSDAGGTEFTVEIPR